VYDDETETWWFSVIDVVQVLTESANANRYWSDLKRKLSQEAGSEQPYEKIVRLKMLATDGKQRRTDAATAQTLEGIERPLGEGSLSVGDRLSPTDIKLDLHLHLKLTNKY
jgi:hypothetical protein